MQYFKLIHFLFIHRFSENFLFINLEINNIFEQEVEEIENNFYVSQISNFDSKNIIETINKDDEII